MTRGLDLPLDRLFDVVAFRLLHPIVRFALHHGAVLPEERFLERTFGDAWRGYAARMPRSGWPD